MTLESDTPYWLAYLLLYDEDFSREVAPRVQPDDFPQGALRGLTMLARDQAERYGRSTTQQTLTAALEAGFPAEKYGTDAESMRDVYQRLEVFAPDEESYDRICDQARLWLRHRHARKAADDAQKALDHGDLDLAIEALDSLQVSNIQEEPALTLGDVGLLYEEHQRNGAIPTGLPFIDEAWEGGIRPHQFGVLFAVTSVGKSMSLCHLACESFRSNHNFLYYSSELVPPQILGRIVSGLIRRPYEQVHEAEVVRILSGYRQNHGISSGAWIKYLPPTLTPAALKIELERMERDGDHVDVVLLDSADDMSSAKRIDQDWLRLDSIYNELRGVALSAGTSIWTSTQANQAAVEKAKLGLQHMGRSFAKAQRGHFVVGVGQTEQQREDPVGPIVSVRVVKDSEHGSIGRWAEMAVTFGRGKGYPGFRSID